MRCTQISIVPSPGEGQSSSGISSYTVYESDIEGGGDEDENEESNSSTLISNGMNNFGLIRTQTAWCSVVAVELFNIYSY